MADTTTKRIIEVDATNSVKTLREMSAAIEESRKQLQELDKTSDEYAAEQVRLKAQQKEFNKELSIQTKEATAVKGSYNDLVNQLARLKEAWKNTGDATERQNLANKINDIKGNLDAWDHSIGNWQRNVGNYAGSIKTLTGLFGKTGQEAGAAVNGIAAMTGGLKALSATPAIAILSVLVTILQKLKDSFTSSESALNSLSVAFSPLKAAGQVVTLMFQNLAKAVASVAEWVGDLIEKMGLMSDRMKENQEITKEEIALRKKQREVTVQNAKDEAEASELRMKANDRAKYSAKERLDMLNEASAKEKAIADRNVEVAEMEYDIIKRKSQLTENDIETNNQLAEAEAKVWNARRGYTDTMRRITSQISTNTLEIQRNGAKAVEEFDKFTEMIADEVLASIDDTITGLDEKIDLSDKNWKSWADNMGAYATKAAEDQITKNQWMIEDEEQREIASFNILQEAREKRLAYIDEALDKEADPTRMIELYQAKADLELEIEEAKWAEEKRMRDKNAKEEELSMKTRIKGLSSLAKATSGVLGSIADMWEASGDLSEQEAERVKGVRVAGAIIDTIAGAVAAYMGMIKSLGGGPWAIAAGAASAAAVLASGYAQVQQIQNTDASGRSSVSHSGSAAISAPPVATEVPVTRSVTSASDEDKINQRYGDQRVYLVYSDVEQAGRRVGVQSAESSF